MRLHLGSVFTVASSQGEAFRVRVFPYMCDLFLCPVVTSLNLNTCKSCLSEGWALLCFPFTACRDNILCHTT